ncbi:MAG: hypothetical protein ACTS6G_00480 [Candidatus Hodgkinia cicadicola]
MGRRRIRSEAQLTSRDINGWKVSPLIYWYCAMDTFVGTFKKRRKPWC